MKNDNTENQDRHDDEMRPEYDFRSGVRGKHAGMFSKGHVVRVHKADKTVVEHHFTLEEGAVMLEPDVREYFRDSESVNKALRSLITLVPRKRRSRAKVGR
jgi:hypothetical protein